LISGGEGSEQLSLACTREVAGRIATKVEDELALVVGELLWKLERDERGDIFAAVLGETRNEAARSVEVDGARGDSVLASEVWEDCCDGLLALGLVLDAGRWGGRGAVVGCIGAGLSASGERSGGGQGGDAEKTSDNGLSVHFDLLVLEYWA